MYEILILTKGIQKDHLYKLQPILNKLKESGLTCNVEKYLFGKTKIEYLSFGVTFDGVKPMDKKEAIKI